MINPANRYPQLKGINLGPQQRKLAKKYCRDAILPAQT